MVPDRQLHQFETDGTRKDSFGVLMRRLVHGNEEDPVQPELIACGLCKEEMAPMDRVEGAAQDPELHYRRGSHQRAVRMLLTHLAGSVDDILVRRQFLKAHGPAGMQPVRADADFRPQPKLESVGKPGGGVDKDCG